MELMAHRGASGIAPENTLASFRKCLEYSPEWIELDVHATQDGQIVVMHDGTVDRTTNGSGAIADLTFDEIRQLDAGSWFGAEFAGEPVPLLSEVVALVGQRSRLDVEIKGGPDLPATAAAVVDILRAGGILGLSEISSFDLVALVAVQKLTTEPEIALITGDAAHLALCREHGFGWLNLHFGGVTAELVQEAHAAGIGIAAWTIDDLARWEEFKALGVDFFCTNLPHLAPPPGAR